MANKAHLIQYHIAEPKTEAQRVYALQRKAYLQDPYPSYKERRHNLEKLHAILSDNEQLIIEAMKKDYGHRPAAETRTLEMMLGHSSFRDIKKQLKKWMKPQSRKVSIFYGGKNRVIPQPKGVVGIVVPWNYPTIMFFSQVSIALAAGNRVVVKMAEYSKNLRELLARLVADEFPEDVLAIVPDARGGDFSSLPFDHILFTGSPTTGKTVMAAAAQNLCPVTLELGGKSPTIICDDFDLETAAKRILQFRFMNAGQTCLSPEYVFIPRGKVERFIEIAKRLVSQYFPDIDDPEGYTSIIDDESFQRLRAWLSEVEQQGSQVVNLVAGSDFNEKDRKFPPYLVVDPSEDSALMKHEIFGPIMPVIPYDDLSEVIEFIAVRDRPLALYLFSNDKKIQEKVLYSSISGGVTINHVIVHMMQHHMPFGGAGASGIGQYHSFEGFMEFSKMRPVFWYPNFLSDKPLAPPYGKKHLAIYRWFNRLGL